MAARTDIHKPSAIVPTNYQFVAITTAASARLNFVPQVRAMNAAVEQHMTRTGGAYATHEHKGNCQSCGAHCVYMAVFHHAKSNEYLRVGLDCAEKLGVGDVNRFRTFMKIVQAAQHHRAGRRKAQGLLHLRGLDKAWDTWLLVTDLPRALQTAQMQHDGKPFDITTPVEVLADFAEEYEVPVALVLRALAKQERTREIGVVCDIVSKVVKYGNLSDAQARYLATLLDQIEGKVQPPTPAAVPGGTPHRNAEKRTVTVQGRNGTRSVSTDLTDVGAISVLRKVSGDEFVTNLVRQYDAGTAGDSRYSSPLSSKQWSWVHVLAAETEARAEEDKAREASAVQVATAGEMQGIHDLFAAAQKHLKRARIRLAVPHNASFRVYTLFPMRRVGFVGVAGADPETGRGMVGEITPQGTFTPRYGGDHDTLRNALGAFAKDPATGAKESARLTGNCCFCGLTLTDERSTEKGYGPQCAKAWSLPWGARPVQTHKCAVQLKQPTTEGDSSEEAPDNPTAEDGRQGPVLPSTDPNTRRRGIPDDRNSDDGKATRDQGASPQTGVGNHARQEGAQGQGGQTPQRSEARQPTGEPRAGHTEGQLPRHEAERQHDKGGKEREELAQVSSSKGDQTEKVERGTAQNTGGGIRRQHRNDMRHREKEDVATSQVRGDKSTPAPKAAPVCKAVPAPSAPQVVKVEAPKVELPEPVGTTVLLNTDQFHYANKLFTAEASDLLWSRKWPDTIKLTSSKTGVTKTFALKGLLHDQDNDLQCGDYAEVNGDLAIRVFND